MVGPRHITEFPTITDSSGEVAHVVPNDVTEVSVAPAAAVQLNGDLSGFVEAAVENTYATLSDFMPHDHEVHELLRQLAHKAYALGQESKDYTK